MGLFTSPVVRASDADNDILSGAKWHFYNTGTVTPATIYSNSALTTPHTNPVVADAGGMFAPIFLDPAVTYRAVLKTAGDITIQEIDPYTVAGVDISARARITTLEAAEVHIVKTPLDYGAVGDGTTDDRTAMLNALQSGNIIDGLGKAYAISAELAPTSFKGLRNATLKWSSTSAMAVQQALLKIRDLGGWFIDNVSFDLGTVADTGFDNDTDRNGLKVETSVPLSSFNSEISVTNCRAWGYGNGTGLNIRNCTRGVVSNNMVYQRRVAATPDPTNDCQNGIAIYRCKNLTVADNVVHDLQTQISGAYERKWSRGMVFVEMSNSTVTGNVVSETDQGFDFSGGIDSDNPYGNLSISCSGNQANDNRSWGFKFANVARDFIVSGNIVRRFGLGGFVVSGPSLAADVPYATQRILLTGNYAFEPTGDYYDPPAAAIGFRINLGGASTTHPVNIRMVGCTADAAGTSMLAYGFHSELASATNIFQACQSNGDIGGDYGGSIAAADWRPL